MTIKFPSNVITEKTGNLLKFVKKKNKNYKPLPFFDQFNSSLLNKCINYYVLKSFYIFYKKNNYLKFN